MDDRRNMNNREAARRRRRNGTVSRSDRAVPMHRVMPVTGSTAAGAAAIMAWRRDHANGSSLDVPDTSRWHGDATRYAMPIHAVDTTAVNARIAFGRTYWGESK